MFTLPLLLPAVIIARLNRLRIGTGAAHTWFTLDEASRTMSMPWTLCRPGKTLLKPDPTADTEGGQGATEGKSADVVEVPLTWVEQAIQFCWTTCVEEPVSRSPFGFVVGLLIVVFILSWCIPCVLAFDLCMAAVGTSVRRSVHQQH